MKGRKPTPAALKLVTGNPGKRGKRGTRKPEQHGAAQEAHALAPPDHLSAVARSAWCRIVAQMAGLGILAALDAFALELVAENYAEILELRTDIAKHGRYQAVTTKSGGVMERARPAATMLADAERRFRGVLGEFGMTPVARERIGTSDDSRKAADPAEAYFG